MLLLFYIITVVQNGGRRLRCIFCTAWLCYAEFKFFERFPAFPRWLLLLLQFLPQDHVVSPLESRTPGLACTANGVKSGERGGQVIGPPRPIHLLPNVSSKYSRTTRSRDSVVGIATIYGLDDGRVGVQAPVGVRILNSPNRPDRL
jgi:hypothetical protein